MTGRLGKHAFTEQLVAAGVRYIFGNPGTTEQAFIDHLQDVPELELILALHEGVAIGAAEGHARVTGQPSFALLHTAAGLGNAMGMLANAFLGHTPMVIYVGDMPRSGLFQEPALSGPIVEMARPISRWVHEVRSADEIPQVLRRAFKVALQEPQGPVVIVVPSDIMDEPTAAAVVPPSYVIPATQPDCTAIAAAVDLLAAARNPAILVADGVARAGAVHEAATLAEMLGAPILQGYATEVCVPAGHPLDAGALPLFAPDALARKIAPFDCILALGSEVLKQAFPDASLPFGPDVPVIQVGLDPWELAKNQPALAIQASPLEAIRELSILLKSQIDTEAAAQRRERVQAENHAARAQRAQSIPGQNQMPIAPARAVDELARALPADVVLVDESVSAQPWVQHCFAFEPGSWLRSRGGGLGAGLSIALGAQLADPSRRVVSLVGDGAAMYTVTALWTAAHHSLPVVFIVLNNQSYKMLKLNVNQYLGTGSHGRSYVGMDLTNPAIHFPSLARGFGIDAERVTTAAEIAPAIERALSNAGPQLIEIIVDGSVNA